VNKFIIKKLHIIESFFIYKNYTLGHAVTVALYVSLAAVISAFKVSLFCFTEVLYASFAALTAALIAVLLGRLLAVVSASFLVFKAPACAILKVSLAFCNAAFLTLIAATTHSFLVWVLVEVVGVVVPMVSANAIAATDSNATDSVAIIICFFIVFLFVIFHDLSLANNNLLKNIRQ